MDQSDMVLDNSIRRTPNPMSPTGSPIQKRHHYFNHHGSSSPMAMEPTSHSDSMNFTFSGKTTPQIQQIYPNPNEDKAASAPMEVHFVTNNNISHSVAPPQEYPSCYYKR
jgi:hypothetical protein